MLGLPDGVTACLFDLDGVLTRTAKVHAAAWKSMFDEFLEGWARRHGQQFVPFDEVEDYDRYVDGKPRYDGVRSFLEARGIELPQGTPEDPPSADTIDGLGNRKNETGAEADPGAGGRGVRGVGLLRARGDRRGAEAGGRIVEHQLQEVLRAAGIDDLFDQIVDGVVADREHLKGKPAPDTYLAGARAVGVEHGQAAVFEDALAGVEAGRAGSFGFVVGVDRVGQADALREHGADVVVRDLAELLDERS